MLEEAPNASNDAGSGQDQELRFITPSFFEPTFTGRYLEIFKPTQLKPNLYSEGLNKRKIEKNGLKVLLAFILNRFQSQGENASPKSPYLEKV